MQNEKLRVLVELRACLEGFSGIPMETRLVFRSFNNLPNIQPTGLINHPSKYLTRGLTPDFWGRPLAPHRAYYRLSRLAISVRSEPLPTYLTRWLQWMEESIDAKLGKWGAWMGRGVRVTDFDATAFGDFMWQGFFSNTLPASDYETIRTARYATIRPSNIVLQKIAIERFQTVLKWWPLPKVNTRGYDVYVTQMPWSTRLAPETQLVVRYHDAIPVFLPHTIERPAFHQAAHMAGLEACRHRAVFACNSEATRADLLKIYPDVEKRTTVVPDIVSNQYFVEKANEKYVANTVRRYVSPATEPKFLTSREKERFYDKHLLGEPLRYLLIVSSLDLRKNHGKLIGAWDYLRNHGLPGLKLIFVGEQGWEHERIVMTMSSAQQRGELFHLTKIPFGQLRVLYGHAAAVVCPSVAEGFDLSGIEAMLCGGAVVASDIPVHREVYGNACEFFNPYSAMELAKALERVVGPEGVARREELVEAGLRHAPKYRNDSIEPVWQELFERIRRGEFRSAAQASHRSHTPP